MLFIDINEKSKIPGLVSKYVETKKMLLPVGDYAVIGPVTSVCVSSKSAEDYIGSIESGHINGELIQMAANFDKCVLMVHGNIDRALRFRKLNRQLVFNFVAGVISRQSPFGLKATPSFINFFTPSAGGWKKDVSDYSIYDAVQFLKSLHDIISTDDVIRKPTAMKVKIPDDMNQLFAIQYLFKPTKLVGEKRARDLQRTFGSIKNIANASAEDFAKIDGIGKKTSKEMYKLLNEVP